MPFSVGTTNLRQIWKSNDLVNFTSMCSSLLVKPLWIWHEVFWFGFLCSVINFADIIFYYVVIALASDFMVAVIQAFKRGCVMSWRCVLLMPSHKLILLTGIGQSYDTFGVIKWKRTKQQRTDSLDAWRCGKIWKEFHIKLKLTNQLVRMYYWVTVRTQEVAPHERSARGDSRV